MGKDNNKDNKTKNKKSEEEKEIKINFGVQCRSFTFMVYIDQIGHRMEKLDVDASKDILDEFMRRIKNDSDRNFEFFGITHFKEYKNDFDTKFEDKPEKTHAHITVIHNSKSQRCSTTLRYMKENYGLDINLDRDKTMYQKGGFKINNEKSHGICSQYMYCMHLTNDAIKENKPEYEENYIITSLDSIAIDGLKEEYNKYMNGLFLNRFGKVRELDEESFLFDLLSKFESFGYNLDDINDHLYDRTLVPERYYYKYLDKIEKYYYRGINRRVDTTTELDIDRVSIFIQGPPGCGKSYGVVKALKDMGKSVYCVTSSSGTGGEDGIKANQCIVYDDRIPKDCLDKADQKICRT